MADSGKLAAIAVGRKQGKEEEEEAEKEEEQQLLMEKMAVLDFDMLCSTVALQTHQGKWVKIEEENYTDENDYGGGGGVFRMWEGEILDCFDDRRLAIESACCPCYRFGKNMRRAGFGSCFIQGFVYFIIAAIALSSLILFFVTKRKCFLYIGVSFALSAGAYMGFYRSQMKKKFNIKGSDSSLDDCVYHLVCPCCTLCQESRTLEMNNVQDGTWHGRGDTICIGTCDESSKSLFELIPPPIVLAESPKTMQNP